MTSNQRNWSAFLAATGLVLAVSFAVLAVAGNSDDNIRGLLRLSARAAFVLLLLVFIARPLRHLVRTPRTQALLKNRRLLGIGFAGVHTAHLVLILYLIREVPAFEFDWLARVPGMATYLMMYLMLITSFDRPARAIGPRRWKFLHKVGLYWLFIAFAQREIPKSLENVNLVTSLLTVLIVAALVIRISAYLANRTPKAQPQ